MEAENRSTITDLTDELLAHGKQYSFFQAVKLLETAHSENVSTGRDGPLTKETIRFQSNPSLGFPASEIESIEQNTEAVGVFPPYTMTVNFMGLYGPSSPLPTFYTEEIVRSDRDESQVQHFLDIFNHRLVSFVYRAWEKYRYYILFKENGQDQFSQWMFALIGLGNARLRSHSSIDWVRLLPYLGLLGMRVRSASVLTGILSHYFGDCPVHMQEYVRQQVVIGQDQRNSLGVMNCSLDMDCSLGASTYDLNNKFKLRIGPLDFKTYVEFLPDGRYYQTLRDLTMFVLTDKLDYDVELVLVSQDVPQTSLAKECPCQLGYSTWLGGRREGNVSVVQKGSL
jgi:type VI secretion system protein ImpH